MQVLKRSGADGKKVKRILPFIIQIVCVLIHFLVQVVFLFTDLQIKDEAFLEDISMILTTGSEVASAWHSDFQMSIGHPCQIDCQSCGWVQVKCPICSPRTRRRRYWNVSRIPPEKRAGDIWDLFWSHNCNFWFGSLYPYKWAIFCPQ